MPSRWVRLVLQYRRRRSPDRARRPGVPRPTAHHADDADLRRTLARTGVSRSTRSTCCSAPTTCRSTSRMGSYETTLLDRAAQKPRRPFRILGSRGGAAAGRAAAADAAADGVATGTGRHAQPRRKSRSGALARRGRARGPSTARDLDDGAPRDKEHWGWNWSEAKRPSTSSTWPVTDLAGRNRPVRADLRADERVLPAEVLALPTSPTRRKPIPAGGWPPLARRGGRCAAWQITTGCRRRGDARRRALVEDGELLPVQVEGWKRPACLHRDTRQPRKVDARAM